MVQFCLTTVYFILTSLSWFLGLGIQQVTFRVGNYSQKKSNIKTILSPCQKSQRLLVENTTSKSTSSKINVLGEPKY